VAFSPDGRSLLATAAEDTARLWEVTTGKQRGGLPPGEAAGSAMAFSADGRLAAVGDMGGGVRLWDLALDGRLKLGRGGQGRVTFLAFTRDGKMLVSGGSDTTLLLWDVARLSRGLRTPTGPLTPDQLESAWGDLGGPDAAKAYRAIWALARAPDQAVPLVRLRVRRAGAAGGGRPIDRLIADLDHDDYPVREKATRELEALGRSAEAALRQAARTTPSPEVRHRAEALLKRLDDGTLPADVMEAVRAVEVLERIGNAPARRVLEDLAGGSAVSPLTEDARAALRRLSRRSP
jgi:hypothetical protein